MWDLILLDSVQSHVCCGVARLVIGLTMGVPLLCCAPVAKPPFLRRFVTRAVVSRACVAGAWAVSALPALISLVIDLLSFLGNCSGR